MNQYSSAEKIERAEQAERASFYLYYNAYTWPAQLNIISHELITRMNNERPNTIIERGVVTALNFFISQRFLVSMDEVFPNEPNYTMPQNWLNNIWAVANQNIENARYYVRKREQTFGLFFSYDAAGHSVSVDLKHTAVKHRSYKVDLREEHLAALTNPEHAYLYALHCTKLCTDTWTEVAAKAEMNRAPTAQRTPSLM